MIRHGLVCTTKEWHWKSVRRCATWWSSIPTLARWQRVQFWIVSILIPWFQSSCPAQICADVFLYSAILWRMRTFDGPIPPTNYGPSFQNLFKIGTGHPAKAESLSKRGSGYWIVDRNNPTKQCGRDLPTLRLSSNVRFIFHSFIFSGMSQTIREWRKALTKSTTIKL